MTTTFVNVEVQIRLFTLVGHNKVMNDIHRETMEMIKHQFWPFHFMTDAYRRYPGVFAKRTKRYQMMKARVVGHQRPNVFTGALRLEVLLNSKVSATAAQGRLAAKAPMDSKIIYGPRAGQTIRRALTEQRRKELEFVSPEEIEFVKQTQLGMYRAAVYDPQYQTRVLKKFR